MGQSPLHWPKEILSQDGTRGLADFSIVAIKMTELKFVVLYYPITNKNYFIGMIISRFTDCMYGTALD